MTKKEKPKKEKTYQSLSQFSEYIEKQGEKIIEFNGYELITKRGKKKIRYALFDGKVTEMIL
jgi:hypothetical protein|tara:strand:- start:353 stop:538 length:186 start_codon:yes stop_codon:yes gene_type:complete